MSFQEAQTLAQAVHAIGKVVQIKSIQRPAAPQVVTHVTIAAPPPPPASSQR